MIMSPSSQHLVFRSFYLRAISLVGLISLMGYSLAMAGESGVSLQRATISVSSVDESIAFYQDILGFTVRSNTPYDTPALRRMFHMDGGSSPRLVLLDAGEEQPRALALVHADGMVVDRESNTRNAPALVFNVTDMDDIHNKMLDAGVEVLLEPTQLLDFSGLPLGREAAYYDPDGVRIVLFEFLKRN